MFTEEICIYLTCILVAIIKNAVFLAIFLCYIFACSIYFRVVETSCLPGKTRVWESLAIDASARDGCGLHSLGRAQ